MNPRNCGYRVAVAAWLLSGVLLAAQPSSSAASTPLDLVKQGQKLNSEGKQDEALALYQQALQSSPNRYEAHLAAGVALDLKGEYQEARHHLDKAIALASPDTKAQALR